ncbi:hypothetical protein A2U01_0086090, partial [Trifolium medium]|nr:hypothetical protein [Trifolium medium]
CEVQKLKAGKLQRLESFRSWEASDAESFRTRSRAWLIRTNRTLLVLVNIKY